MKANYDHIDDYLMGRLSEADKTSIETAMKQDPAFAQEVAMQRDLIAQIEKARVAELKSFLQSIPVPATSSGSFGTFSNMTLAAKIAATSVLILGSIATYWFFSKKETATTTAVTQTPAPSTTSPINEKIEATETPTNATTSTKKEVSKKVTPVTPSVAATPTTTPEIPLDPQVKKPMLDEQESSLVITDSSHHKSFVKPFKKQNSDLVVHVFPAQVKNQVAYQYEGEHVNLYGNFGKNLYEIIEINGEEKALFLFYQNTYYFLPIKDKQIHEAKEVTDRNLKNKLEKYRTSK